MDKTPKKKKKPETQSQDGEILVQLATRIPKDLFKKMKLHCAKHEVSMMDFVREALEKRVGRGE